MDLVCFRGVGGESEIVVYPGQCTSLLSHICTYFRLSHTGYRFEMEKYAGDSVYVAKAS